ncbi:hypothetical protein D6851_02585 [Altericroceibacterium spongiae]|uniref:Phage tail protein n=1 Tax=Altericroceibacterium spongiae TaxID=2320269 RepID=A0A420ERR9_9SPHN|nr:hypothetical protein [Altericroceibacterium spongiae]RKF23377.1 hypothetical protein D6851_02585 [Altericroceibacterium spongiae]
MPTDAVLGSGPNGEGTELWLTNDQGEPKKVDGLITVNRPNLTVASESKTSHDSGGVNEYMAGMMDPGEMSGSMYHVPDSDDDKLFIEHIASKQTRPGYIKEVKKDGTAVWTTFAIFLTQYEPDDAPVNSPREAEFTAQVTGMPDYAGNAPAGYGA